MNTPILNMTKTKAEAIDRFYTLLTEETPEHGNAEFQHIKRLAKVLTRIVFRNIRSGQAKQRITKRKLNENEFPMNVVIQMLHEGNADFVRRNLEANRGFGNGHEDHINSCRICQRKLKTLETKEGVQ